MFTCMPVLLHLPRDTLHIHSCLASQGCGVRVLVRSLYTAQSFRSSSSFLSSIKDVATCTKACINVHLGNDFWTTSDCTYRRTVRPFPDSRMLWVSFVKAQPEPTALCSKTKKIKARNTQITATEVHIWKITVDLKNKWINVHNNINWKDLNIIFWVV